MQIPLGVEQISNSCEYMLEWPQSFQSNQATVFRLEMTLRQCRT
jgi:hypothetical protein